MSETPAITREGRRRRTEEAVFRVVKGIQETAIGLALSASSNDHLEAWLMVPALDEAKRGPIDTMDAYDKVDATQRSVGDGSELVGNVLLAGTMACATNPQENQAATIRQETLAGLHPDAQLTGLQGCSPWTARMEKIPKIEELQAEADVIAKGVQDTYDMVTRGYPAASRESSTKTS